jgi:hypothetical protein
MQTNNKIIKISLAIKNENNPFACQAQLTCLMISATKFICALGDKVTRHKTLCVGRFDK